MPTKKERALAIAQDALEHLNFFKKIDSCYGEGICPDGWLQLDKGTDAQPYIDKITKKCKTCALGACFISHVRLYDKVTMDQIIEEHWTGSTTISVNSDLIVRELKSAFTPTQMILIESAFESEPVINYDLEINVPDAAIESAIAFGATTKNKPRARLKMILQNIVDNGGEFKPNMLTRKELKQRYINGTCSSWYKYKREGRAAFKYEEADV